MLSRIAAMIACVLVFVLPVPPVDAATGSLTATGLSADGPGSPLGIDDAHPTLSWRLASAERDSAQTAYQVRVTGDGGRLVWDSGKVTSAAVSAAYGGPALGSRDRLSWRVRLWDAGGRARDWSPAAHWEMGLLNPSDRSGQWISDPDWTRKPTPVTVPLPGSRARAAP